MVSPMLIQGTGGSKFFWNVDANVGAASPNNTDDVQLVQFGYFFKANAAATPPEIRPILAQVKVGIPCTGLEDDPLVKAIRAHQRTRAGTQDGHVSVIKTSNGVYFDATGGHAFMLISIVNNLFDAMPADFPRIDKHPQCPAALKATILASMNR